MLFVRPCAAVGAHMVALASGNPLLQFPLHDAEQDFLNWCDEPSGACCTGLTTLAWNCD